MVQQHPFFDNYLISDKGQIFSKSFYVKRGSGKYLKPGKELSPKVNKDGYFQAQVYKDGKSYSVLVHRLVAEVFIVRVMGKDVVNHKNGNKMDNRSENLEWCTKGENHEHAVKFKLKVENGDKPVAQYDLSGNLIAIYKSGIEAARQLKLSAGNISQASRGLIKTYKGFIWKHQ